MNSVKGWVAGRVQGVGFRYFVREQARALGVTGFVRNLPDGRVEFLIQGDQSRLDSLLDRIRQGPAHSRVDRVDAATAAGTPAHSSFDIR